MNIESNWANAAVNVALRSHDHKKVSDGLRLAARVDPQSLRKKISQLKRQIELLESYLPDGK